MEAEPASQQQHETLTDVAVGSEADAVSGFDGQKYRRRPNRERGALQNFCTSVLNLSLSVDFALCTRNSHEFSKAKVALAFEGSNPVCPAND
jgi:hypothetical protein